MQSKSKDNLMESSQSTQAKIGANSMILFF